MSMIALSKLRPDDKNARKHSKRNIEEIMRSLKDFGQHRPFVVQQPSLKILIGNGMYQAMKKMGWKEGMALYVDDDDTKAIKRALADNRTAELAEWDNEVLLELLSGMDSVPGWSDEELKNILNPDEAYPDIEIEYSVADTPISKLGDVWNLGRHRVMCGDATNKYDIIHLMDGLTAVLTLTDPPYGISVVDRIGNIGGGKDLKFKGKIGGIFSSGKHKRNAKIYSQITGDESNNTALKSFEHIKKHSKIR